MEKKIGMIDAVSQKEKGYGININQEWYNGFGKCPVEKGDNVEMEFELSEKGFRNIKAIAKTKSEYNTADQIKPEANLDTMMFDTIVKVEAFYRNENALAQDFKEKIDWTKIIDTIYMAKARAR